MLRVNQDGPAHNIPVTLESAKAAYAPANLEIPEASQRTPAETFVKNIMPMTGIPQQFRNNTIPTISRVLEARFHKSDYSTVLVETTRCIAGHYLCLYVSTSARLLIEYDLEYDYV
jgi:hypothetical protein